MRATAIASAIVLTLLGGAAPGCGGATNGGAGADAATPSPDGGALVPGDAGYARDAGDASAVMDVASATDAKGPPADGAAPGVDASGSDAGGTPYDHDGPIGYTTVALPVSNGSSSFTENVYIPSSSGAHPVVSLSPGLQQPSAAYAPYAKRLASYGIVVELRDDPGILVSSDSVTSDITYVVSTWLPAQNAAASSPLFGKVDTAHVGLAGHSRGGQSSLLAAEGLAGMVVAWFGLDPVNVSYNGNTQAITNIGSLRIPTTYLGASVATNCCPANDNYEVLYASTPSPSVAITAVNASHMMFLDLTACALCTFCTPVGTANAQVVLAYSVRYLTAFFARELLGDASVGATFQGAGGPADVVAGLTQMVSK